MNLTANSGSHRLCPSNDECCLTSAHDEIWSSEKKGVLSSLSTHALADLALSLLRFWLMYVQTYGASEELDQFLEDSQTRARYYMIQIQKGEISLRDSYIATIQSLCWLALAEAQSGGLNHLAAGEAQRLFGMVDRNGECVCARFHRLSELIS